MSVVFGIALLTSNMGCGSRPAKLNPVSGKVTVNGLPAEKAKVFFTPLFETRNGPILPFGVVEADGSFQVSTYRAKDGAPEGEYAVTIVWPTYESNGGEEVEGPDRLQGRYNNAQMPFLKVTVVGGDNALPDFELKAP